jgi:hypothetical protein
MRPLGRLTGALRASHPVFFRELHDLQQRCPRIFDLPETAYALELLLTTYGVCFTTAEVHTDNPDVVRELDALRDVDPVVTFHHTPRHLVRVIGHATAAIAQSDPHVTPNTWEHSPDAQEFLRTVAGLLQHVRLVWMDGAPRLVAAGAN